jgi:DNA-binding Lrp family transcriptional regulator
MSGIRWIISWEETVMDAIDRAIVMQVQDGIPLVDHPFMDAAEKVGIPEEELIARIGRLRNEGVIRRFGARLNNRRCGFTANAMVAWKVPEDRVDEVGRFFAGNPVVTHCYERKIIPGIWEHNVFTMVHCQSETEVNTLVEHLAEAAGVPDYQVLVSGEEFKRTVSVRITGDTTKAEVR